MLFKQSSIFSTSPCRWFGKSRLVPWKSVVFLTDDRYVHMICALYHPGSVIENATSMEPIAFSQIINKDLLKKGGCIRCLHKNCYDHIHATCPANILSKEYWMVNSQSGYANKKNEKWFITIISSVFVLIVKFVEEWLYIIMIMRSCTHIIIWNAAYIVTVFSDVNASCVVQLCILDFFSRKYLSQTIEISMKDCSSA